MSVPSVVMFTTFTVKKKNRSVYFHNGVLLWDCEKSHSHHNLSLEDVICVSYDSLVNKPDNIETVNKTDHDSFILYYGKRSSKNVWKLCSVTFSHPDPSQIKLWVETLQTFLNNFKHRPKKLLLFVNPFGGKKKAMHVFEKYGKPLFSIAGVNVTVVVSQRQNQIRDCLLTLNLDIYDSVACVGGDGTFAEVFNGLVLRACREQNININDIDVELPKPKLPVGIIPGGSTNTIVYCLHGTDDVRTSILQIIFGNSMGLDLLTVYNEQNLLRLCGSIVSYGCFGDILLDSEKYRWMGPNRYEYTGFKKFMLNSGYNVELAFCDKEKDDVNDYKVKCCGNCDICQQRQHLSSQYNSNNWKLIKGKYFMMSGANISCACSRSPTGFSPYSHLGNGFLDLVLVKHTNVINNLRLLLTVARKNQYVGNLPFVEVYRTNDFCLRAPQSLKSDDSHVLSKFSSWNCDGEIIPDTNIRVKVRCQLLNVLSRGSRYQEPPPACC